jgi:hypothetical protein
MNGLVYLVIAEMECEGDEVIAVAYDFDKAKAIQAKMAAEDEWNKQFRVEAWCDVSPQGIVVSLPIKRKKETA